MSFDSRTFHGLIPLTPEGWPKDEPLLLLRDVQYLFEQREAALAEAVRVVGEIGLWLAALRLYRSQHDDECGCEGCSAYDDAMDEVSRMVRQ